MPEVFWAEENIGVTTREPHEHRIAEFIAGCELPIRRQFE
jgi:hypothetical protein